MYKTGAKCPGCTLTSKRPIEYSTVHCTMYTTGATYPGLTLISEHHKQYNALQCTKKWFLEASETKILNFWFYNFKDTHEMFEISIGVEKRETYQKLSTGWNLLRCYIEQGRTWRTTTHHVVNVAMPEKKENESVTSSKSEPFFKTKIIKQLLSF